MKLASLFFCVGTRDGNRARETLREGLPLHLTRVHFFMRQAIFSYQHISAVCLSVFLSVGRPQARCFVEPRSHNQRAMATYRGGNKGLYVLLSRTQAGPGRTVKQESKRQYAINKDVILDRGHNIDPRCEVQRGKRVCTVGGCEKFLPGPAWLLLNKTYKPFLRYFSTQFFE